MKAKTKRSETRKSKLGNRPDQEYQLRVSDVEFQMSQGFQTSSFTLYRLYFILYTSSEGVSHAELQFCLQRVQEVLHKDHDLGGIREGGFHLPEL